MCLLGQVSFFSSACHILTSVFRSFFQPVLPNLMGSFSWFRQSEGSLPTASSQRYRNNNIIAWHEEVSQISLMTQVKVLLYLRCKSANNRVGDRKQIIEWNTSRNRDMFSTKALSARLVSGTRAILLHLTKQILFIHYRSTYTPKTWHGTLRYNEYTCDTTLKTKTKNIHLQWAVGDVSAFIPFRATQQVQLFHKLHLFA